MTSPHMTSSSSSCLLCIVVIDDYYETHLYLKSAPYLPFKRLLRCTILLLMGSMTNGAIHFPASLFHSGRRGGGLSLPFLQFVQKIKDATNRKHRIAIVLESTGFAGK
jgi:hypothetical protein